MRSATPFGLVIGELPQEAGDLGEEAVEVPLRVEDARSAESAEVMFVSGNWKSHSAVWRLG